MYRSTSPRSDRAASRDGPHMSSRFPRDQLLRSAIWPAASRRSMVVWPVAFVRVFEATDLGAAAQGPVHRVRTATGDQAWLVTGYQEVRRLLADPRLGRSHPSPASAARTGESVLFGAREAWLATGSPEAPRLPAGPRPGRSDPTPASAAQTGDPGPCGASGAGVGAA